MVDGVLGQVLNYRSRQRGLDLEEERMRQNQEYRDQQLELERQRLGQYDRAAAQQDRALALDERTVRLQEEQSIRDNQTRQALAGLNEFQPYVGVGNLEEGGNLIELKKDKNTYGALKAGKFKGGLLQQLNTLKSPDGFTYDNVRVETVNGETFLTATGRYASGEPGVATREAGSGADETVIRLSLDEAVDLLNERIQLSLNELDPVAYSNIQNTLIGAVDARNTQAEMLENNSKISAAIQSKVSLAQDALLEREVLGTLGELKGNAKRAYMLKLGREFLNPDDPETVERLNLLEQSLDENKQMEGVEGEVSFEEGSGEMTVTATSDRYSGLAYDNLVGDDEFKLFSTSNAAKLKAHLRDKGVFEGRLEARNKTLDEAKKALDADDSTQNREKYDRALKQRNNVLSKVEAEADKYDLLIQDSLDTRIALLEKDVENNTITGPRLDELNSLKAEKERLIKSGATTKSMAAPEFKGIEEKLRKVIDPNDNINQFKDVSPEFRANIVSTIDAAVDNGQLTFTEKQTQIAAKAFEEAGIEKIEDFKNKLPPDRQLIAYSMLTVMAPDAEQRSAVRELLDITAIGGDAAGSSLDKFKATSDRQTSRAALMNAITKSRESATQENQGAYDEIAEYTDTVFNLTNRLTPELLKSTEKNEQGLTPLQEVNFLLSQLRRNRQDPRFVDKNNPQRTATLLGDAGASLVSAAIGNLIEPSFFGGSPSVNVDDVNISNLYVDDPDKPTKISYQSGSQAGKSMSIGAFKNKIKLKEIQDLAVTIARDNTRARANQEE
tara:strand:+ start:6406 stop:8757 length:2352 start_codon:yes stop_codon:yes gene_type:complete